MKKVPSNMRQPSGAPVPFAGRPKWHSGNGRPPFAGVPFAGRQPLVTGVPFARHQPSVASSLATDGSGSNLSTQLLYITPSQIASDDDRVRREIIKKYGLPQHIADMYILPETTMDAYTIIRTLTQIKRGKTGHGHLSQPAFLKMVVGPLLPSMKHNILLQGMKLVRNGLKETPNFLNPLDKNNTYKIFSQNGLITHLENAELTEIDYNGISFTGTCPYFINATRVCHFDLRSTTTYINPNGPPKRFSDCFVAKKEEVFKRSKCYWVTVIESGKTIFDNIQMTNIHRHHDYYAGVGVADKKHYTWSADNSEIIYYSQDSDSDSDPVPRIWYTEEGTGEGTENPSHQITSLSWPLYKLPFIPELYYMVFVMSLDGTMVHNGIKLRNIRRLHESHYDDGAGFCYAGTNESESVIHWSVRSYIYYIILDVPRFSLETDGLWLLPMYRTIIYDRHI
jgi:hypothetical protein